MRYAEGAVLNYNIAEERRKWSGCQGVGGRVCAGGGVGEILKSFVCAEAVAWTYQ